MNQSCNFDVLLDLDFLELYKPIYFMKKDKKPDTLAVLDNYNFFDIQTDRQGAEPVKSANLNEVCYGVVTLELS